MREITGALLLLGCSWLTGAQSQEGQPERGRGPPAPDLDFLEYLGTWAEGDDEWLAIEEFRKDLSADARAPRGAENAEGAEDAKGAEDTKEFESERDDDDESE